MHERRLKPVLENDEHSLARLSTHPSLLRQGDQQRSCLLKLFFTGDHAIRILRLILRQF